jgi:hypothetical protein
MIRGRCLCEGVAFEIDGDITEIGMCHCSKCRRVSGVASNAEFMTAKNNLKWASGEDLIQRFQLDSGWRVWFCSRCGSTLPKLHPSGGAYWVPAGLVEGDPGVRVAGHIYVASKAAWDEIGGSAPQFDESFPGVTES